VSGSPSPTDHARKIQYIRVRSSVHASDERDLRDLLELHLRLEKGLIALCAATAIALVCFLRNSRQSRRTAGDAV
jgi:hypothetical protein